MDMMHLTNDKTVTVSNTHYDDKIRHCISENKGKLFMSHIYAHVLKPSQE